MAIEHLLTRALGHCHHEENQLDDGDKLMQASEASKRLCGQW